MRDLDHDIGLLDLLGAKDDETIGDAAARLVSEYNVAHWELDCERQKLSDARAALRAARINFAAGDCADGSISEDTFDDFVTGHNAKIDRALAATPAPITTPATRKEANGVTNFTDTQKAERQAALATVKPTPVAVPATKRKFTGGGTRNCVPAPVAVPVCAKCKGSGKYDAQCAQSQCSGFHDCDCKTPLVESLVKASADECEKACDEAAPDPVQAAYAECARIARNYVSLYSDFAGGCEDIATQIEASAERAVTVRPGALYAAMFPAVPAILRLFIESACPLDAEMARGVLAAVEGLK